MNISAAKWCRHIERIHLIFIRVSQTSCLHIYPSAKSPAWNRFCVVEVFSLIDHAEAYYFNYSARIAWWQLYTVSNIVPDWIIRLFYAQCLQRATGLFDRFSIKVIAWFNGSSYNHWIGPFKCKHSEANTPLKRI